jgi:hypothetical protein
VSSRIYVDVLCEAGTQRRDEGPSPNVSDRPDSQRSVVDPVKEGLEARWDAGER